MASPVETFAKRLDVARGLLLQVRFALPRDLLKACQEHGGSELLSHAGNEMLDLLPDSRDLAVGLVKELLVDEVALDDRRDHVPVGQHLAEVSVLLGARGAEVVELLKVLGSETTPGEKSGPL